MRQQTTAEQLMSDTDKLDGDELDVDELDVDELDLSDEELMEVLKNHGIDRRNLMRVLGAGAGVAVLSGSGAAQGSGGDQRRNPHEIDDVYGAPYLAPGAPDGLSDHQVELHVHIGDQGPEFFFDPVGIHVHRGDIVDFHVHHGLHTVNAIHSKYDEPGVFDFPDRVPESVSDGFSSPVMNTGDSWVYQFNEPGLYDIMCLPHYSFGMVVRVVVTGPNDTPVPEDSYDDSLLPPAVEAVFDDPLMTPDNIVSEGTVAWDDLTL